METEHVIEQVTHLYIVFKQNREYLKMTEKKRVCVFGELFLRQVNKDLKNLVNKNFVIQVGKGRSVKYVLHD